MAVKYRRAENKWNVEDPPWDGAVGIEEVDYDDTTGDELYGVPALVCWFTRGSESLVQKVVKALNG